MEHTPPWLLRVWLQGQAAHTWAGVSKQLCWQTSGLVVLDASHTGTASRDRAHLQRMQGLGQILALLFLLHSQFCPAPDHDHDVTEAAVGLISLILQTPGVGLQLLHLQALSCQVQ